MLGIVVCLLTTSVFSSAAAENCAGCHRIRLSGIHDSFPCLTCHQDGTRVLANPASAANRAKGCTSCHRGYDKFFDRAMVIRDGGEIYALNLVCTVTVTAVDLICPCHGSVYDRQGTVLKGPATRPLPRYRMERRGENLVIFA